MKRREFITLLGGTAAALPLAVRAQQGESTRRIGVLIGLAENDPLMKEGLAGFREGLERRGWTEGHNFKIDYRFVGDGPDRYQSVAKELVALQPDVILAHSNPVELAPADDGPARLHTDFAITSDHGDLFRAGLTDAAVFVALVGRSPNNL